MPQVEIKKDFCFVIGPIGHEGSAERKLADMMLKAVVQPAMKELNIEVKRADDDTRPGAITEHIINDILKAGVVVADLTGLNPNVMYELGIAHMALRPTIPIALIDTNLPFDNLAQRTIFIDTTDHDSITSAIKRLKDAVTAVRVENYVASNPVTQANSSYRLQNSTDSNEQVMGEMKEQMEQINAHMNSLQGTLNAQAMTLEVIRMMATPYPGAITERGGSIGFGKSGLSGATGEPAPGLLGALHTLGGSTGRGRNTRPQGTTQSATTAAPKSPQVQQDDKKKDQ